LARIKVNIKGNLVYEYEDFLRVTDMNYGNHLGNDKVLGLFHDARMRWMNSIEQTELKFFGKAIIQHDAVINYRAEAHCHDQIRIKIFIDDIDTRSFDFYYQLLHSKENKEIAIGKTGMTFFDYENKKISSTPSAFQKQYGILND
jgi:acyl-CoA thioester hydrolase